MTIRQTRRYGAALAVLCATASAAAQVDGQAAWLWEVTTQDGDAIVEPGETATVTLSIDMEPDVGSNPPVIGFGGAIFDIFGDPGAAKGQVLGWSILNELDSLAGDTTTSDGVNLFGASLGQLPTGGGPFSADDPIDVISFEWDPVADGPFVAHYFTQTTGDPDQPHSVLVWTGADVESTLWPIDEAAVEIVVVPSPSSAFALILGLGGGLIARRRVGECQP